MELFDTHFHIDSEKTFDEYAQESEAAGVKYLLAVGSDFSSSLEAQSFAEHTHNAFFAAGVHPHESENEKRSAADFANFAENPSFAAVGEIGLDYFYEYSNRNMQRKVFESFLELSVELKKPAVVHCRDANGRFDAYSDAYSILKDFASEGGNFTVHCFTGTEFWAEKFLELGAYLGFTGIVTFKKAENVRNALRICPDERILIETDSPYLAPVPVRGKKNLSAYLPYIAERISEIKALKFADFAEISRKNAFEFLNL